MKNYHYKYTVLIALIFTGFIYWGCGNNPSSPPDMQFGELKVYAYYDSTYVDTSGASQAIQILAPEALVIIDDSSHIVFETVPVTIDSLVPGLHNVYVEYEHSLFGKFRKTILAEIDPGVTNTISPTLTQFAESFDEPAIYYDTTAQQVAYIDHVTLDQDSGKVILLFYFGAT